MTSPAPRPTAPRPVPADLRPGSAVRVRPPATSANLGPGFDALGLALGLYDDVVIEVLPADPGPGLGTDGRVVEVDVVGEGAADVPRNAGHLVVRAFDSALRHLGVTPPSLRLTAHNRIPHARGLGSSSAAICTGLLAARELVAVAAGAAGVDVLDDATVLALATAMEGHPDNVAACLAGGLTVAWTTDAGPRVRSLQPHPGVRPVVAIPGHTASTAVVRGLLPATVPHADAAHAAGRAALLMIGLTLDPTVLMDATEDRLHQPYRVSAMPESAATVARLRDAGVPAVISGAGPSVLALARDVAEASTAVDVIEGLAMAAAVPLRIDAVGATVTRLA